MPNPADAAAALDAPSFTPPLFTYASRFAPSTDRLRAGLEVPAMKKPPVAGTPFK